MGEMACYTDRCPQCGRPPPGGKPILQAARPAPQQGYGRPRSPRPHGGGGGGGGGGYRQQQQYYHGEGGGGGGGYANSNL